jgi:hypothetical protein
LPFSPSPLGAVAPTAPPSTLPANAELQANNVMPHTAVKNKCGYDAGDVETEQTDTSISETADEGNYALNASRTSATVASKEDDAKNDSTARDGSEIDVETLSNVETAEGAGEYCNRRPWR